MRVSVVNFCSTAIDMLHFSTEHLIKNAGTDDYDYILVTWNPNDEVQKFADAYSHCKVKSLIHKSYTTNQDVGYVPNLRAMMNFGFDCGYELNSYVVIVNADMMFGKNWLVNLVQYATKGQISNSLHITPIRGAHVITANCGVPTAETFNMKRFWQLHDQLYADKMETERQRGGWMNCATMPYVIHRQWWECCGPWKLTHIFGNESPDRQFFRRCHEAGATFVLVNNSICYHHEAVERRSKIRPVGIENMPEGR